MTRPAKPARHGGKRPGAGRPPKPPGTTLDTTLRVGRADLERWREVAARYGFATVQDLLDVAIEQVDPSDREGELADLGRAAVELARNLIAKERPE